MDSHSSRTAVARRLVQPTRRLRRAVDVHIMDAPAYLALLQVGFARRNGYPPGRALLPHDFTLACANLLSEVSRTLACATHFSRADLR